MRFKFSDVFYATLVGCAIWAYERWPDIASFFGDVLHLGLILAGSGIAYLVFSNISQTRHERHVRERELAMDEQRVNAENALLLAQAANTERESKLVRPVDNQLPVGVELVNDPRWAMMALQTNMAYFESRRTYPNVPNSIRLSNERHVVQQQLADEEEDTQPFEEWITPSFQVLYQQNAFPTNGQILLGFSEYGEQVLTELKKFASVIIAGASGKGKSSLFRYCLLQHMMQAQEGLDLLLCDPHAHAGDDSLAYSLSSVNHMFLGDVASNDEDILSAAKYCVDIGQRRVDGDKNRRPLMLVIDEISLLMDGSDISDELGHCLKRIGREFRKVAVMAVVIGQQFGSNVMDTSVRNSFTRVLACPNIRDNIGNMLPNGASRHVEEIQVGQFVDYEIGAGTQIISFPETTRQDVEIVATSATTSKELPKSFPATSTHANMNGSGSNLEGAGKLSGSSLGSGSIRELQVISAIENGDSDHRIAVEIYGVRSGRRYQAVREEIERVKSNLSAQTTDESNEWRVKNV